MKLFTKENFKQMKKLILDNEDSLSMILMSSVESRLDKPFKRLTICEIIDLLGRIFDVMKRRIGSPYTEFITSVSIDSEVPFFKKKMVRLLATPINTFHYLCRQIHTNFNVRDEDIKKDIVQAIKNIFISCVNDKVIEKIEDQEIIKKKLLDEENELYQAIISENMTHILFEIADCFYYLNMLTDHKDINMERENLMKFISMYPFFNDYNLREYHLCDFVEMKWRLKPESINETNREFLIRM